MRTDDDDQLVGVLPLVRRRSGPARIVEFADLGVSDYALPVLHADHAEAIRATPGLSANVRSALGGFDLLQVERVPGDPS